MSAVSRLRSVASDDAALREIIAKREAQRQQTPTYKKFWSKLAEPAGGGRVNAASLLYVLVTGPFWLWPRRAWQAAWPTLREKKAGWMVLAPWLLLIGICLLVLVFDTFTSIIGSLPASSPDEDIEMIGLADLKTLIGGGGVWASLLSPRWARLSPFLLWPYRAISGYVGAAMAAAVFLGPLHVLGVRRSADERHTSHGSAVWGTWRDALTAGLLKPKNVKSGLVLGRFEPGPPGSDNLDSRLRALFHAILFAPPRTGKGVSTVIPNLLEYPGSVFCIDLKGELYAVTARRRKELGQAVARIDPFAVTGKPSHQINWLDAIDTNDPACVSESLRLANALVVKSKGDDSHWDEAAAQLLQGLILFIAGFEGEDRHIGMVWDIVSAGEEEFTQTLKLMANFQAITATVKTTTGAEVAAGAAKILLNKEAKERSSIVSTLVRHVHFLSDPRIVDTLRTSSFKFEDLKRQALTVYLIIPPEQVRAYNRYVRAMVALGIQAQMKERKKPPHPVLFLLDEFYQLGRCDPVADTISIVGGLGIVFLLILHNVGQLKSLYDDWEGILACCSSSFFSMRDLTTAEYVSKALGKQTILVKSHSESSSRGGRNGDQATQGTSENESAMGRLLQDPSELLKMAPGQTIVLGENQPPFMLQRIKYYTDAEYAGQHDPNPLV